GYSREAVHGPDFLGGFGAIPMELCWEAGRFLRDRNIDCSDAVVAVTTAAAQLASILAAQGLAAVVVGEVEPHVALRHLEEFGLPVRIGAEIESPQVDGLLGGRYAGKRVVPFAIELSDITEGDRDRWRGMTGRSHLLKESTHVHP
ncbi:MAG: hypothetical protein OEM97_11270, partial [Acidimicrobiia bacterium]|nr:hypothetical protein [Acidimicrobiia bacterium]